MRNWSRFFGQNSILIKNNSMAFSLKRKGYQCKCTRIPVYFTRVSYGAKRWTTPKQTTKILQRIQRKIGWYKLGTTRREKNRTNWAKSQMKVSKLIERIKHIKWKWVRTFREYKRMDGIRRIAFSDIRKMKNI